ncbi:MAG: tetratricopeptide repeat protein [Chitinispirillaceae bacterium]|jgi:Flp pilus assembly protein TadD|nr:tetratricopeptide repeat protein [Chitinispirillaceae bacterium]
MLKEKQKSLLVLLFTVFLCVFGCSRPNVEKGSLCLRLGDYPAAIVFFERALAHNPIDYNARVGLGKAFLQKAADNSDDSVSWRTACRHLSAAQTLQPSESLGRLQSQVWAEGAKLLVRRDTIAALEALTRSMEYDPKSVDPVNRAGIIYFRLNEFEKARMLFQRALKIDSANTPVLFNLGMIEWARGDHRAAHGYWLRGLKLAPRDEAMLYWFARAEKQLRTTGQEQP